MTTEPMIYEYKVIEVNSAISSEDVSEQEIALSLFAQLGWRPINFTPCSSLGNPDSTYMCITLEREYKPKHA